MTVPKAGATAIAKPAKAVATTNNEVLSLAFFMKKGLTAAQAAGIVGNLKQESNVNPATPGGGLDQGQGARAESGSLGQQLEKIWAELTGSEGSTLSALKRAKTPQEAARVFSTMFERPGIPDLGNREHYAAEAYTATTQGGSNGSNFVTELEEKLIGGATGFGPALEGGKIDEMLGLPSATSGIQKALSGGLSLSIPGLEGIEAFLKGELWEDLGKTALTGALVAVGLILIVVGIMTFVKPAGSGLVPNVLPVPV